MSTLDVLVHDPESTATVPEGLRVATADTSVDRLGNRVAILTRMSTIADVAGAIRALQSQQRLKALLVRADANAMFLPQVFSLAGIRALRNTLIYSDPAVPARVLNAWSWGSQDVLIASATAVGNRLMVVSCVLETIEVPFDMLPALRAIPDDERGRFEISEEGSFIHWPGPDVDLDLDALRYAVDPEYRKKTDAARLLASAAYGRAIATLRKKSGLTQAGIEGISERQMRRIETGEQRPTLKALELLAAAHGMALDAYLQAVAQVAQEQKQQAA